MSRKISLTLPESDYALARAHAADRGLPLAALARSLLMAEIKRHAHRTGLLSEIERIVDRRISALSPTWGNGSEAKKRDGSA